MKIRAIVFIPLALFAMAASAFILYQARLVESSLSSAYAPPTVSENLIAVDVNASFAPKSFSGRTAIGSYYLKATSGLSDLSLPCPPVLESFAREHPNPRRYHVEYWDIEQKWWNPSSGPGSHSHKELSKLTEDGIVIYDASQCPLHQVAMNRQTVGILYGLPDREFLGRKDHEFPNSEHSILGGCSPDDNVPETRTWCCPECIAAEAAFQKEQSESRR